VWTNNIEWAPNYSDEERSQIQDCIILGQQLSAMHYFDMMYVTEDQIHELIKLTIQFNTMVVFSHIVRSYRNLTQIELDNDDDRPTRLVFDREAQKEFMFIALSSDSLPSTLLHLIKHRLFLSENIAWLASFSVLFRLPSRLPSIEDMLLQSEPILSKLKIIVENGANPRHKNYDRFWYSGFDEFTEWCVYTNATDDTIHTGFNILLQHARHEANLNNTVFDIVSLFHGEILRIICMNRHHTDKDGRPTINLQECSEKSSNSVLRMMIFFKTFLRFLIDQVDRDSDNVLFYTTKSEVVAYLIDNGVNPHHTGHNGECAVFSILRQINYGTAVEEYTYEQVEEVRQCIDLLYSYNVGCDVETLANTLVLVKSMHAKNPHFEILYNLVMSLQMRKSFIRDSVQGARK
jgi:hypothetical protein